MFIRPLLASTAISLVLSAGIAGAITPEEVWTQWKAQTEQAGATMTVGSESRSGDALEITDVTATQTTPEASIVVTMNKIVLRDRGDGSVDVIFPDRIPFSITAEADEGPFLLAEITQHGGSLIASGAPQAMNFEFNYPTSNVTLTGAETGGSDKPTINGSMTLSDLTGKYLLTPQAEGSSTFDYAYNLANLKVNLTGVKDSVDESFKADVEVSDIVAEAKGTILPPDQMQDFAAALRSGFALTGSGTSGAVNAAFEFNDGQETTSASVALSGSSVKADIGQDRLDYGFGLKDLKLAANAPSSGMPAADASLSEMEFAVKLPLAKAAPGDFKFLTRLVDLKVSDSIWGIVDPTAQLARDPATLVLDLTGRAAFNIDQLSNPERMAQMPGMPARIEALNINQILLRLVGGEVDAKGALTFNNSDLQSWGGVPAPDGNVNVTLKGINALIDKAVAMGLVPENDVMSVRMGLAMFTRPGSGPDTLVSEILFKDNGLFVNGQQLR